MRSRLIDKLRRGLPRPVKDLLRPALAPLFPRPVHSATGGLSNEDYNRELWNGYAQRWTRANADVEDERVSEADRETYLRHVGDEWGRASDVREIVDGWIAPYVDSGHVVAEIGSGGGRIASQVAPRVAALHCFDISSEMLARARQALDDHSNVQFHPLETSGLPDAYAGSFDFVYAFDVLVHLDLHTLWRYFRDIHKVLRPGATAFLHTTNLRAPAGWDRFAAQSRFTVEGHCFVVPEVVELFAAKAGFAVEKRSVVDASNFYLNRDFLIILRK